MKANFTIIILSLVALQCYSQSGNVNQNPIDTCQVTGRSQVVVDKNGSQIELAVLNFRCPIPFSIPVKKGIVIKSYDSIPSAYNKEFDNDLNLITYANTTASGDTIEIKAIGKASFLISGDFLTGEKYEPTIGLRPTKIELTNLREGNNSLMYLSYKITPNPTGKSYLLVDGDAVLVINAKVININPKTKPSNTPANKKK